MRAFLDASVLVAAVLSRRGGSFRLVNEGAFRGHELVTSRYGYREAEEALKDGYEQFLASFYPLLKLVQLTQEPNLKHLQKLRGLTDDKDIPIVAGALAAKASHLITLDRKHLLRNTALRAAYPALRIVTPGDFIRECFV